MRTQGTLKFERLNLKVFFQTWIYLIWSTTCTMILQGRGEKQTQSCAIPAGCPISISLVYN
jgi:hypothetical protein